MTIADLLNNLIESSRERIKNPLISSFFYSFALYNWRPILFLMFSDASFENKIIVINNEYCYPLAILVPILFAVIYTIYVPVLMVIIDKNLEPVKIEKIKNLYIYKDQTITEKLSLADKEFLLKSTESGNKDRELMIQEKEQLKRENDILKQEMVDTNEGNANIIKELNVQLQNARNSFHNAVASNSDEMALVQQINAKLTAEHKSYNRLLELFYFLDANDYKTLAAIRDHNIKRGLKSDYNPEDQKSIRRLISYDLIHKEKDGEYILKPRGIEMMEKIDEIDLVF